MQLSVIIVNHNHPELLTSCIQSLDTGKGSVEVETIIVDNASSYPVDKQIQTFQTLYQNLHIRLVKNSRNLGFGKANNQGVKISNGEFVLFLNTDCFSHLNSVEKLYTFALKHPDYTIIGGKLVNPDLSDQPSAGRYLSLPAVFAMLFLRGDRIGLTRYSPKSSRVVDWVSGACFIMKKTNFEKLDGFDEQVFMYMEEIELMRRAKIKSMNTYFYHGAVFTHIGAATSENRTTPVLNIFIGLMYLYSKYHSPLEQTLLRLLLRTKARISVILGKLFNRGDLVQIYEKADRLVG